LTVRRFAGVAVAGVALALALAGCAQSQLGAAALYNNQRISTARLAAEVANLNAGYQHYHGKVQITYPASAMPREVLSWMLRFATTDRLATQRGIKVTPADAEHELNLEKAQVQQAGDTLPEAAVLNGLPPDLLNNLGRWISIQRQLTNQLDHNVAPTTSAQSNALNAQISHLQCVAAKSLDIKVNPQYGAYDYAQLLVVQYPSNLSKPSAGGLTVAPQLTPKC
jgi:hypothetical protein